MIRSSGFTLVELLVVIALVAILAGLVVPGFTTFIRDNRMSSQLNTLIGSLHFARGEAASRRTLVTVCASNNQSSCSNNNAWEQGWIIFTDGNNSGNGLIDGDDELLQVIPTLEGNTRLRESGFDFATGRVQFNIRGFLAGSDPQPGTFTLCNELGATAARAVVLNISGVTRLATDEDNDGIVNDHGGDGSQVSC